MAETTYSLFIYYNSQFEHKTECFKNIESTRPTLYELQLLLTLQNAHILKKRIYFYFSEKYQLIKEINN